MFKKITSSNDCNLAANKLNIIFDGTTLSDADSLPSGCIEHQSEARFNTDSTNVASSSSKPICKSEGKGNIISIDSCWVNSVDLAYTYSNSYCHIIYYVICSS